MSNPVFCPLFESELQELMDSLQHRFVLPDGTAAQVPNTFNTYLTTAIGADGRLGKAEGEPAALFDNPEIAWRMWKLAFTDWLSDRPGPIYWRLRPMMMQFGSKFAVWARVFVARLGDPTP